MDVAVSHGNLPFCKLLVEQEASLDTTSCKLLDASSVLPTSDMFVWLLEHYGEFQVRWSADTFKNVMSADQNAATVYLNQFAIDRDQDKDYLYYDFFDLVAINGDHQVEVDKTIAVEFAKENKNVLAHPVMQHIINAKWKNMRTDFYSEAFFSVVVLISYSLATVLGDTDWAALHNGSDYGVQLRDAN